MGSDFFWDGNIPEPDSQKRAVEFIISYFHFVFKDPNPVIIKPQSGKRYKTGIEKTREKSIIQNYPFDYYGVTLFWGCESLHDRMQFIFDRSNNGRMVTLLKTPEIKCEHVEGTAIEGKTDVIISDGGYYRFLGGAIDFALMLHVLRLRYSPNLSAGDDYSEYDDVTSYVWHWGFKEILKDETLDFPKCWNIFFEEYRQHFPDSPVTKAFKDTSLQDEAESLPEIRAIRPEETQMKIEHFGRFCKTKVEVECLQAAGIKTFGDLVRKSSDDLLEIPEFGETNLKKITELLRAMGLELRDKGNKSNVFHLKENNTISKKDHRRSINYLIKMLSNKTLHVSLEAMRELGKRKAKKAVLPIIKELEKNKIPEFAAVTLGEIADPRAVTPLINTLKDKENKLLRTISAEVLGEIGDTRAVTPLIEALRDDCGDVREYAAKALSKIGDTRAIEPLIIELKDDFPKYRRLVAELLIDMGMGSIDFVRRVLEKASDKNILKALERLNNMNIAGQSSRKIQIELLANAFTDNPERKKATTVRGVIKIPSLFKDESTKNEYET